MGEMNKIAGILRTAEAKLKEARVVYPNSRYVRDAGQIIKEALKEAESCVEVSILPPASPGYVEGWKDGYERGRKDANEILSVLANTPAAKTTDESRLDRVERALNAILCGLEDTTSGSIKEFVREARQALDNKELPK